MKLSIVIPVFNEEKTIGKILQKVNSVVIPHVTKEILVVDDGSTDATASKIKNQSAGQRTKIKNLKVLTHKKNTGKGAAVKTGVKNATGDYIVIQDADLEYDPDDLIKLMKPISEGKAEVIYGTRLYRLPDLSRDERMPLFLIHYFGNRFLSLLTSILYGQWITDMETGYKIFSRNALGRIRLNSRGFEFEPEITAKILKQGYKILEVPIKTNPRGYKEGKKLNTFRDGFAAFWTLIKYRFTD